MEGWPDHIELFKVPRPIKAVGKFLGWLVTAPHLFSPVSDHTFEHPLDPPLQQVIDWPTAPDIQGRDVNGSL